MSAKVNPSIRIANAPCSWGTLEFELRCGEHGYLEVLNEMSRAGYAGTELGDWGFMPTEPAELSQALQKVNLELTGALAEIDLCNPETFEAGLLQALAIAELLKTSGGVLVLSDAIAGDEIRTRFAGRIEQRHQMSEPEWERFARHVHRVADTVLDKTGIRTVFHPHVASRIETPYEIARLMQLTDASRVGLCLDTGHICYGGGNPLDVYRQFAARVNYIHLRDVDMMIAEEARLDAVDYFEAVKRGVFCEPGQGCIDFAALFALLESHDYAGWLVVEQEMRSSHESALESAWRSRNYLKRYGF